MLLGIIRIQAKPPGVPPILFSLKSVHFLTVEMLYIMLSGRFQFASNKIHSHFYDNYVETELNIYVLFIMLT